MTRSSFKRLAVMLGALALLVGLLPMGTALAATVTVDVTTGPNAFTPQNLSNITAGDTVTWRNVSGTHDVSSANIPAGATAFVSPLLTGSATYSQTFTVVGNYRYFCSIHAAAADANAATQSTTLQVGQFTVVAAAAPAATPTPAAPAAPAATPAPATTVPDAATEAPEGMPASAVIVLLGAALVLLAVGTLAVRRSR